MLFLRLLVLVFQFITYSDQMTKKYSDEIVVFLENHLRLSVTKAATVNHNVQVMNRYLTSVMIFGYQFADSFIVFYESMPRAAI